MALVDRSARVVCIGGLDPTGAAGLGADLKVLGALGVYGAPVATAVTVQTAGAFRDLGALPASVVGAQLDAALEDLGAVVVKTGMLVGVDTVSAVADRLERLGSSVRVVIDPVLSSTSGRALLDADGRAALVERLLPLAALVTPNTREAGLLAGFEVSDEESMGRAADVLLALGASAVLIKGGHLPRGEADASDPEVVDLLRTADGDGYRFADRRLGGPGFRGTGCALAAAIAAHLAEGCTLRDAVERARRYLYATLEATLAAAPSELTAAPSELAAAPRAASARLALEHGPRSSFPGPARPEHG
jgi:hydroxymethylpyrimidine/phosphomethylpyrimidine kinase